MYFLMKIFKNLLKRITMRKLENPIKKKTMNRIISHLTIILLTIIRSER